LHTPKEIRAHSDLLSILKAGKRAEKLTNQLLAFSRKQMHELKVIDINEVIHDLDKMLRRLIPTDIQVENDLCPDLPYIKADPGQIEQILINLVVNARDAIKEVTKENSARKILIQTKFVDLDDLFVEKHQGSKTGPHILIAVKDTGIGMNADVKNRIFEPFFTTKEVGKGTGLGLSTVYGIIKQNVGYLNVESKINKGTVFNIYWPVTSQASPSELVEKLDSKGYSGSEKILLVEDDEGVRNFTVDALENYGYKVSEAIDGKNAIELISIKNLKVDLVITDIIMPEINGKEFVSRMQDKLSSSKILFVSGYTYEHLLRDGTLDEKLNFLQKPYSINKMLKTIRKILDEDKSG